MSYTQSQIGRTLADPEAEARVAAILAHEPFDNHRALGRRICEVFDFRDRRGRLQITGCLRALQALADRSPAIVLPPAKVPTGRPGPSLLATPVAEAIDVPER